MIRSQPKKPIRVFLTSNENDADTPFGNWALANKTMANALNYAGYDYRFEFGKGGHSLNHGGSIFADSLRWLMRHPTEYKISCNDRLILVAWRVQKPS